MRKTKKRQSVLSNQNGFTILQALFFVSIAAVLTLYIFDSASNIKYLNKVAQVRSSVSLVRTNMSNLLFSDLSWANTLEAEQQMTPTDLLCLKYDYTGPSKVNVLLPSDMKIPGSNPVNYYAPVNCQNKTGFIDIYTADNNSPAYFSNSDFSGFDLNANPCNSTQPEICPIRTKVRWETVCLDTDCYSPEVKVKVDFDLIKKRVGTKLINFNPNRYKFSIEVKAGAVNSASVP